jgi:hypothetical protein
MNTYIKLSIVVLLIAIGTESFTQTFGIKAGLNLSNMIMKDDEETYSEEFKMKPGFHFGPTIEIPISKLFSVESGLMLSTKGYKESEKITIGTSIMREWESKLNLFYIDLPITAKATFDVDGAKIFVAFGPYVGMGLCGKYKYTDYSYYVEGDVYDENISFGSNEEEDDLKRLDYGLTAEAGFKLKSIQIGISYRLGLANLSNDTEDLDQINNRVLGISVGYKFGGQ